MADSPKPTTFLRSKGFTFMDAPPCSEALALDILVAAGLGNIVAAYLAREEAGRDPRAALDVIDAGDPMPTGSD